MSSQTLTIDLKKAIAILQGIIRQLDGGPELRSPVADTEAAPRDAVTVPVQFGGGKVYHCTLNGTGGKCREVACRVAVQWVVTPGGKNMPINPTPDAKGVYTSHFATCAAKKGQR